MGKGEFLRVMDFDWMWPSGMDGNIKHRGHFKHVRAVGLDKERLIAKEPEMVDAYIKQQIIAYNGGWVWQLKNTNGVSELFIQDALMIAVYKYLIGESKEHPASFILTVAKNILYDISKTRQNRAYTSDSWIDDIDYLKDKIENEGLLRYHKQREVKQYFRVDYIEDDVQQEADISASEALKQFNIGVLTKEENELLWHNVNSTESQKEYAVKYGKSTAQISRVKKQLVAKIAKRIEY